MNIEVNGQQRRVKEGVTIAALIDELLIEGKVAACAVNMEVVKKDRWADHPLKEGDRVELLQFVGGG